jgi:beta-lactamase regulating signal transducer with metallopeptidase domain
MPTLSNAVFAYTLNALWLLPLLVLAAEAIARTASGMRARAMHRLWQVCLLLALVLPCLSLVRERTRTLAANSQGEPLRFARAIRISSSAQASAPVNPPGVLSQISSFATIELLHPATRVVTAVCLLYAASILFALLRLAWGLWQTNRLLRATQPAQLPQQFAEHWRRCLELFGQKQIALLTSSKLSGPATINWPRPIVILPAEMHSAEESEIGAAFCHELAHIERRDFVFNVVYELIGVLLFFHPAWHWIRRRLQQTRELACDDRAAAAMNGNYEYAHNLLRLTEKMQSATRLQQPSCALGIFEGEIMEKRIMNLIEKKPKQSLLRLGLSLAFGLCLCAGICAMSVNFGLLPLRAQAASSSDKAPAGWFLAGSKPASYHTGVDREAVRDGQPSAYLAASMAKTDGFGTLMQQINAANYAGKRVRLRAAVKAQDVSDWAGLWMRVDNGAASVAFDNMQNRAIKGTQSWNSYDVVLDVPQDATGISFGILLSGGGEVWMNGVTVEVVGAETPVTASKPIQTLPTTPVNLSFTE